LSKIKAAKIKTNPDMIFFFLTAGVAAASKSFFTASLKSTWPKSSTNLITSPPLPQPKQCSLFFAGVMDKEGLVSLWKMQRSKYPLPFF